MRWTAYPLRPNISEEGISIGPLFSKSDKAIEEMNLRLKKAAEEAGLPFGYRTMTYNSRSAQEMGKWAESEGLGDAFHNAVFRAYFVDGKNIGKIPILTDLAAQVELSESEAKRIIDSRTFADAVEKDWSRSLEIDPEYIPSILLNGHLLVNPQKYDLYERFMEQNRIKKRIPDR